MPVRLVLASASPRRAELLRAAQIDFDVVVANIDESVRGREHPEEHARRLARAKAMDVLRRVAEERPVLAADTIVAVGGEILGKPVDENDARRMLRMLSGRAHDVVTAVCLAGRAHGLLIEHELTTVEFGPLSDAEIAWYAASGEPMDKAGGYAIQGLASRFVNRISGSYTNVVGLPVALVYRLCKRAGLLVS